jgi:hypothetical protein
MTNRTYDNIAVGLCKEVKDSITAKLRAQHDFIGDGQPFVALQADFTTTINTSYVTASTSYIDSTFTWQQDMLATRSFPGTHTGEQVRIFAFVLLMPRIVLHGNPDVPACSRRLPAAVHRSYMQWLQQLWAVMFLIS